MDCGCTTIFIFSGDTSKSQRASIISNPLFIIVAESMVIFAPIVHCGCLRASFRVANAIFSLGQVLNGPPEAVRCIFTGLLSVAPSKHWNMAECSESTGRIGALYCFASSVTTLPPATNVSLFASAIILPALIADTVGLKPLKPTSAVSTISTESACTKSQMESIPENTLISCGCNASATSLYLDSLQITTAFGWNSRA